ncbi:MAG: Uncharacterised protein [Flavobacteriaceae bacterium]|nr:MAG: Uncharacterised protein [Flavobacteriaceae bacterium]
MTQGKKAERSLIFFIKGKFSCSGNNIRNNISVTQHDPFWGSSGSRGVDDRSK